MNILHEIMGDDIRAGLLIILNLIVVESLLSVDNAAVLATMVIDLPKAQRSKALRYGIVGAYVMRGICLFLAAWLVKIWWLKPLGGLYLIYLACGYFFKKGATDDGQDQVNKQENHFFNIVARLAGNFWATVALVEIMDLAFSIDNVFAVVAFTNRVYLIYTGVFIGILAMRFVAQGFVKLIERFSFLETVAFMVIGMLGIKLFASLYGHFYPGSVLNGLLESRNTDIIVSGFTVVAFTLPLLSSWLFNFPGHRRPGSEADVTDEKVAGM